MIARYVVQTSGGLTATLRRLEDTGRITRLDDPDDRRGRLVALTATGTAFYDQLLGELTERYAKALDTVDIEQTTATVRRLIDAFERFGNRPTTGGWQLTDELSKDHR